VLCLKEAVQYPAGLPSVWHGHLKPAHKATLLDHYIKLFGIDKARINEAIVELAQVRFQANDVFVSSP
jgi:hypothetical protein